MKTNFKNIAAVSAVVFAGVFSANATENNLGLFTSVESATVDYRTEAQLIIREFADNMEARATQKLIERSFSLDTPTESDPSFAADIDVNDFRMEARQMVKEIADRVEARATQTAMDKEMGEANENSTFETTDFRTEAQLITRLIADKEEVKALQKFMPEGRIVETK